MEPEGATSAVASGAVARCGPPCPRLLCSALWAAALGRATLPPGWTARALEALEAAAAARALRDVDVAMALAALARTGLQPIALVAGWSVRLLDSFLGLPPARATLADVLRAARGLGTDPARVSLAALSRLAAHVSPSAACALALAAAGCAVDLSEEVAAPPPGDVVLVLRALRRLLRRPPPPAVLRRLAAAVAAVLPRAACALQARALGQKPGPALTGALRARVAAGRDRDA